MIHTRAPNIRRPTIRKDIEFVVIFVICNFTLFYLNKKPAKVHFFFDLTK